MNQLSLSARPKTLDALIGQEKTVAAIRGHFATGRTVKAWFFSGVRGVGKTSCSRILAMSYQCQHQKVFGTPCKECRTNKACFPIYEINASEETGKDSIREALEGVEYGVLGRGKYRVYILDEVQRLSDSAQNLLLKYLEDTPETTVFILCSTAPQRVLETVRRRCVCYELRELETDEITVLVTKLLKFVKSDLPADRLVDELVERGVGAPGLIAQAVEKYVAGLEPADAAQVEGATTIDVRSMTRSVVKGDWDSVSKYLKSTQNADVKGMRLSLMAYMKAMLIDSPEISDRTKAIALAIDRLVPVQNAEGVVVSAALSSALYQLTSTFAKFRK